MHGDTPTLGDVIRRFGPALLDRSGAGVTPAQRAVLNTLERCHTAALGGHLYRCDTCGTELAAYNGCGNRHCPSCLGHKSAQWLQERAEELLPVSYFHVVFTVPTEIAALALGNKKVVYQILLRAAAETLLEVAANPAHLGADIGFLAILHTWTQTLLHHPHVHCVVPGGGLAPDGLRWVPSRDGFFLPVRVLASLFRGKFLAFLQKAEQAGELRFAGVTAALATPEGFAAFLKAQRERAWVVYAKAPFGSPEQVLKYLARYTHRVAISNRRILSMDDKGVTFRYRDNATGGQKSMTLDGVEFLRRFLLHVLPTGFVRIRYYGLLANRYRAQNLERCRALLGAKAQVASAPARSEATAPGPTDANERGRCTVCGAGQLVVVGSVAPVAALNLATTAPTPRDTS
ncbi:MAG: IS91 family transposase [Deltaproteobacteria bacterium]|nr:IS91 family transposase [Deltaproteobacteria bacterium]